VRGGSPFDKLRDRSGVLRERGRFSLRQAQGPQWGAQRAEGGSPFDRLRDRWGIVGSGTVDGERSLSTLPRSLSLSKGLTKSLW